MRKISIKDLPLYSYDYDADYPPMARAFKQAIADVDALLFVTPEYNRSIPGGLKNAIDWASRPWGTNSFTRKPCAVIGISPGAKRPPEFTTIDSYPPTENDLVATQKVAEAFGLQFGDKVLLASSPVSASEDFSVFGRTWGVPYVFWFVGGTHPAAYAKAVQEKTVNHIPSNHSPKFAPEIHPTLETGLQAMLTAAAARLCPTNTAA